MRRAIRGQRVLVTGAGGFIGSAVVDLLLKCGAEVRALAAAPHESPRRLPIRGVRAEITSVAAMSRLARGIDTVIHLAGPASVTASFAASRHYVHTHVMGTATVLEACRKHAVDRLVHVSSAEVYGRPRAARVGEGARLHPLSPYAAAKVGAETLVEVFSRSFGLGSVVLRPFAIYGPGLAHDSLIGTVIRRTRRAQSLTLRDLRPVRDFCYVADLADAIVRSCAAPLPPFSVFNVGTGRGTSVAEVARTIARLRRRRIVVTASSPRPAAGGPPDRLVADPRRAARVLGWRPRTGLRTGLRRTIRWMDAR